MKLANAEILKTNSQEGRDISELRNEAHQMASEEKMEANQAEEEERSIELELIEAQAAHERKEEAERQGKETNEKIAELTG